MTVASSSVFLQFGWSVGKLQWHTDVSGQIFMIFAVQYREACRSLSKKFLTAHATSWLRHANVYAIMQTFIWCIYDSMAIPTDKLIHESEILRKTGFLGLIRIHDILGL
jgi:hypothetical protein